MKRRTLDIIFSGAVAALAVLLLIGGFVLTSNERFAKDYVHDQLADQGITFKAADELSDAERAYTEARTGCLFDYAGQAVTTGPQAECYANELIGGHLKDPDRIANANGMSYVELGDVQGDLRAQIADAKETGDPSLAALETRLEEVTTARDTVFKGTMLRGSLLTTFGFSELGAKAGQAATVAFVIAGLLALISIAGFLHAFVTPRTKEVEVLRHHTHPGTSGPVPAT